MLSIIDLIERQTLPVELAAYLLTAIHQNASILIGAEPGGAGKTTVMGALLGVLPPQEQIISVENSAFIGQMEHGTLNSPITYIIHEIGTGNWYGYLWGESVTRVVEFIDPHTRFMSNLHSDTYSKVIATFTQFGSIPNLILKIDFLVFLTFDQLKNHRYVCEIWESFGDHHIRIYTAANGFTKPVDQLRFYKTLAYTEILRKLKECSESHIHTIKEVANFLF